MSDWAKITLGDFIDVITDYHSNGAYENLKQNVTLKYEPDFAIMIRTLNFESNDFRKNLIYLNEFEYNYLSKSKVEPYDLIMNKIANPGSVYLMPRLNQPVSLAMNLFLIRFNKRLNQKFMFYLMKINESYIKRFANGTTTKTITKDAVRGLKFKVPVLSIQEQIASLLYALDSKIELNNRINTELEAMAKTLYDYWFVQFDFPDKDGKPYKTSGGKMVWNEELKRAIPEGWKVDELKDIANIVMGQSPPGESYNNEARGMIFFQGCTDFGNRFPIVRQFTTQPTRYAKEGDILLSVRAPVGSLNIAKENCCIGRGLAALNSKDSCIAYLFGVMINLKQIFDRRNTDGTTFGSITKDDLFSLRVVKPDKETLSKYHEIINPVFEKQNKIELENQTLAELRDWLLPMLMNGQVQVMPNH